MLSFKSGERWLMSNQVHDGLIAGGLIASPAWAAWLSQMNDFLTTATLFVGLLLGIGRLWLFVKRRRDNGDF